MDSPRPGNRITTGGVPRIAAFAVDDDLTERRSWRSEANTPSAVSAPAAHADDTYGAGELVPPELGYQSQIGSERDVAPSTNGSGRAVSVRTSSTRPTGEAPVGRGSSTVWPRRTTAVARSTATSTSRMATTSPTIRRIRSQRGLRLLATEGARAAAAGAVAAVIPTPRIQAAKAPLQRGERLGKCARLWPAAQRSLVAPHFGGAVARRDGGMPRAHEP